MSCIEDQYRPARIRYSIRENTNHVKQPDFSNLKSPRPTPPKEPELVRKKNLSLLAAILVILGGIGATFNIIFTSGIILGIWLWFWNANQRKLVNLLNRKRQSDFQDRKKVYENLFLTEWSEEQHIFIDNKRQEWLKNVLPDALRKKGWRPHSESEVAKTRSQGWIGPGEDSVVSALLKTNLLTHHQVQITEIYTADIVCLNLDSGKMCVVEIDGKQHWDEATESGRKRIKLDVD